MSVAEIKKIFRHRKTVEYCERQLGLNVLNDREKATLEFIASRSGTRITDILNESYFSNSSLSTVKRSVELLKKKKLIKPLPTSDGRDRYLVIV